VTLVVDASVGLKWVRPEVDSPLAERLAGSDADLLVPDFWLNEVCNVLWLHVPRKLLTPDEAREALALLRAGGADADRAARSARHRPGDRSCRQP
jgi:predicted nucleic acid-binding protein